MQDVLALLEKRGEIIPNSEMFTCEVRVSAPFAMAA